MRIGWFLSTVCFAVICGESVRAEIFIVPLDTLERVYTTSKPNSDPSQNWGPHLRTADFSFGAQFEQISSVSLHLQGTIAPGVFRSVPFIGPDIIIEYTPQIAFFSRSPAPLGTSTVKYMGLSGQLDLTGTFDTEVMLWHQESTGYSWETEFPYLTYDMGEIDLYLTNGVINADVITPALGGISDAYLVVDGVAKAVPEPSSLLGIAVGGTMLLSSRYRWRRR